MLSSTINVLYLCITTSPGTCAVSSTAVFCSSMMLYCPSALLRYFLNDFVILPVVPTINFIAVSSSSTLSPTFSSLSSSLLTFASSYQMCLQSTLISFKTNYRKTRYRTISNVQTNPPELSPFAQIFYGMQQTRKQNTIRWSRTRA